MSKEELNLALEAPRDMDFYLENTGTKEIMLDIKHHSGASTLRDQFAMAALQGLTSSISDERKVHLRDGIQAGKWEAKVAYTLADAMMEARNV